MNQNNSRLIAIVALIGFGGITIMAGCAADDMKTSLQKAEQDHNTAVLKQLCASANPNELTIADAPNEEIAFLMLERGADVNKPCEVCWQGFANESNTALHAAAKWNSTRLIDALIKKGAKVDAQARPEHDTPLHVAAYFGNVEAVERLLKAGANPNLRGGYGNALTGAAFAHQGEHPADPDHTRDQRYLKVFKLLIAAGADLHDTLEPEGTAADIVLKSKDPAFITQARAALGIEKPTDQLNVQGLSQKGVAALLSSTITIKNLSSLAPLLRNTDPDVRLRALKLINETAEQRGEGGMKLSGNMYLEIEGMGTYTTLLDRKWFSSEMMSSIMDAINDSAPRVREQAIRVLSIIDPIDSKIIQLVTNKLSSDPDPDVRLRCVETLGWFATTQRTDLLAEVEKTVKSATIHDSNGKTKLGAAMVLQYLHKKNSQESEPILLAEEFGIPEHIYAIRIKDTRKIPCVTGKRAYRVCVVPDYGQKPMHLKLRLTVPEPRNTWTGYEYFQPCTPVQVAGDKKSATFEAEIPANNIYAMTWKIDNEDHPGKCKLEVFLNDQLTKTFDFEMVASN